MADRIVISGVRRYDGEYEFDLDGELMTTLEWRWVKKISGYLPMTIMDGWEGQDPDLFLAWAVIALSRAGRIDEKDALAVADVIARAPRSAIRLEIGEQEQEADPPAEAPETGQSNADTGGPSSPTSESPQESGQSPTGRLPSETPTSDQGLRLATSAS